MKTLAKGKAAVLAHFEQAARNRTGKEGVYRIVGDDSGNAEFVIIAGHIFSGRPASLSHTLSGHAIPPDVAKLQVENGIVVDVDDN